MKKAIIAVAAVLCFATATCIASSSKIASWTSVSSNVDDTFYDFPTASVLKEKAGFCPKYVKSLGGYDFESFNISHSVARDEDGNEVTRLENIYFYYDVKDGESKKRLFVAANNIDEELFKNNSPEQFENNNHEKINLDGVESAYYCSYQAMYLPPDYEGKDFKDFLTPEQLEAYNNNEMTISYGSSEIGIDKNQSLVWYDNGIEYNLLSINNDFSKEEIIKMAEEIINS